MSTWAVWSVPTRSQPQKVSWRGHWWEGTGEDNLHRPKVSSPNTVLGTLLTEDKIT